MTRDMWNFAAQTLFWLVLVFIGYHLEVRFVAAAAAGYNYQRFVEALKKRDADKLN